MNSQSHGRATRYTAGALVELLLLAPVAGAAPAVPKPPPVMAAFSPTGGRVAGDGVVILDCSPNGGRILQDICDPGEGAYAEDLLQFEAETVAIWLAVHELPPSEAAALYQHGRSDVRSQIRAAMLLRLMEIARKFDFQRTAHEAAVYAWFQGRVWELEREFWDEAVALRNEFFADPCDWTPDPDLAAVYGLSYDGSWCTSGLLSLFATPTLPVRSYFLAAALDHVYGARIDADADGNLVLAQTTAEQGPAIAVAAVASAALIGTISSIAGVTASALFPFTLLSAATLAATVVGIVAVPLAIAALIGIPAGIQAVERQQNEDDLEAMDGLRDTAYAFPPFLAALISDPAGSFKLTAALTDATLPEFSSTSTVPAYVPGTDLPFRVTPSGAATSTVDQFTWRDWDGESWSSYDSGGWLVSTRTGDGAQRFGTTIRFLDWSGTKYFASRLGRRFLVTKESPSASDRDCPSDTLTGLSPPTDLGSCRSYITLGLRLQDASGQNVTVALPGAPAFTSAAITAFRLDLGSEQSFAITATGGPLPAITLAPASSPPPGLVFVDSATLGQAGQARLLYPSDSTGVAAGTYTMTVRATNPAGSVDQTLTIDVAETLAITSPSSVAVQVGVPFSFTVQAVGLGPLTLLPVPSLQSGGNTLGSFGPFNVGFTFVDHGDGSATIGGTPVREDSPCINGFPPSPDLRDRCGFLVTEADTGDTVFQDFSFLVEPAPVPAFTTPLLIEMDRGVPNRALVSASNGFTRVGMTQPCGAADRPAWLTFEPDFEGKDIIIIGDGNGNAFLSGTPPEGNTVEELEIYLHAKPYFPGAPLEDQPAECASNAFPKHTIRLVPRPYFLDPAALTLTAGESHTFGAVPSSLPIAVAGVLPAGATLEDRELSVPATVGVGGLYNVVLSIENAYGRAELPLELTVHEPPALSSSPSASLVAGQPAEIVVTASGFPRSSMTFTPLGPLPDGLSFRQELDIGVIDGTALLPGSYEVPIRIANLPDPAFTIETTLTIEVAGANPQLALEKNADAPTFGDVGDVVGYSYTLTNTGNVPLDGPFTVSDDRVAVDCTSAAASVAPASFTVCTAQHIVGAADVAAQSITNTATAFASFDGSPVQSNEVQATVVGLDADEDGVSDANEDAGPNGGDGNGDGVPDADQSGVTTLLDANGAGYITVVADCPLHAVGAVSETQLPLLARIFPHALVEFRLSCAAANLQVLYHAAPRWLGPVGYFKYGPKTPSNPETTGWYLLPGVEFDTTNIGGASVRRASFALADGELGDDTAVDGEIVDQGGPGLPTAEVPMLSIWALLLVSLMLALAGAWVLRRI